MKKGNISVGLSVANTLVYFATNFYTLSAIGSLRYEDLADI